MRLAGRICRERVKYLDLVSSQICQIQTKSRLLLCRPGGLLGPSTLPIPPTGGGGPLIPLGADGGGIFSEPVLMCRYSEGILDPPLNMVYQLYGIVSSIEGVLISR